MFEEEHGEQVAGGGGARGGEREEEVRGRPEGGHAEVTAGRRKGSGSGSVFSAEKDVTGVQRIDRRDKGRSEEAG